MDGAARTQGVDPPTAEWMREVQRAAETDSILENAAAKRQKVRISCCTPTALQMQNPAHTHSEAHKGESLSQKYACESHGRAIRRRWKESTQKGCSVSLPNPSRSTG